MGSDKKAATSDPSHGEDDKETFFTRPRILELFRLHQAIVEGGSDEDEIASDGNNGDRFPEKWCNIDCRGFGLEPGLKHPIRFSDESIGAILTRIGLRGENVATFPNPNSPQMEPKPSAEEITREEENNDQSRARVSDLEENSTPNQMSSPRGDNDGIRICGVVSLDEIIISSNPGVFDPPSTHNPSDIILNGEKGELRKGTNRVHGHCPPGFWKSWADNVRGVETSYSEESLVLLETSGGFQERGEAGLCEHSLTGFEIVKGKKRSEAEMSGGGGEQEVSSSNKRRCVDGSDRIEAVKERLGSVENLIDDKAMEEAPDLDELHVK